MLFTLEFADALAAVLDGLGSHHAATFIFKLTSKVTHHALGSFKHELKGLKGIGWPRHAHKKADTRRGHGRHIVGLEGARLYRIGNTELHRAKGVFGLMAMIDIHVAVFETAGFEKLLQGSSTEVLFLAGKHVNYNNFAR